MKYLNQYALRNSLFFNLFSLLSFVAILFLTACSNSTSKDSSNQDSLAVTRNDTITRVNSDANDSLEKNVDTEKINRNAIRLQLNFSTFRSRFDRAEFKKFRFVPWQKSATDDVRFLCYALKSDNDRPQDMVGDFFYLSRNNAGGTRETIPADGIVFEFGYSLDTAKIKRLFPTGRPSFRNLSFVPIPRQGNLQSHIDRDYDYAILIDDNATGEFLNPSPPGKSILEYLKIK